MGFSKFGTYQGNDSTDGPFAYCGFQPRFILISRVDSAGHKPVWDTKSEPYNPREDQLFLNLINAQATNDYQIDFLANGFKLRDTSSSVNDNDSKHIFAAFAKHPLGGDGVSPSTAVT